MFAFFSMRTAGDFRTEEVDLVRKLVRLEESAPIPYSVFFRQLDLMKVSCFSLATPCLIMLMYAFRIADTQELLNSNTAGFVYVTEVDMEKRRLAVLSPCPGSLPSRFLLAGTVKWQE